MAQLLAGLGPTRTLTLVFRLPARDLLSLAAALAVATPLGAQCPDGSPPPCRTVTVAAAPRRAPSPPLDDRTWIVLPFDNVAKSQEVDWLRDGSVNLLYLGLSRWNDIRVIDDERVADLVRDTPEAEGKSQISLSSGLSIARRAGAANLVMGDFIKLGSRTAITAKVFDVRTGQRIRAVSDQTTITDSVMPMFGKLAQRILNVAPPSGVAMGTSGTTSVAAYQEYLKGVQALNGFRLGEARKAFEHALVLDSTFALAHYKLTVLSGWDGSGTGGRDHIEAAARLSGGLPARERGLITAHLWHKREDLGKACETFGALLRADSSDVDAWYGLGDCLYHNGEVVPVEGDTTRVRFRADFGAAMHAFRRALEIDPAYHLAYQHLVDGYLMEVRQGARCHDNTCVQYVAFPINVNDSLITVPIAAQDSMAVNAQLAESRRGSRRRNLAIANATAEQWVGASPNEGTARMALAFARFSAGRLEAAASELDKVGPSGTPVTDAFVRLRRIGFAAARWQTRAALALYDSARATPPNSVTNFFPNLAPLFGRLIEYDSISVSAQDRSARARRRHQVPRMMLGIPNDSMSAFDRAAYEEAVPTSGAAAFLGLTSSFAFDFRNRRTWWPPIPSGTGRPIVSPGIAIARGDTAGIRAIARQLDSVSSALLSSLSPDSGVTAVAADAYLFSGDSAAALRMTRRMLDSTLAYTELWERTAIGQAYAVIVPRTMLLRADLAAALGQRDEARTWYQRFIELWAAPDPELRPLLERARKSRAALGAP